MSLRDRVPVEPLDDDRWARVERGVIASVHAGVAVPRARAARSRWTWMAAGGAALAIAAAILVVIVPRGSSSTTTGPLAVSTEGTGTRVDLGDAVVMVAPATAFEVTRPGDGVSVALAHGRVELEVAPRRGRDPLIVHAGDVDVVVVGTHFSVLRDERGVDVEVTHGVVQVKRGGEVVRVGAGERWSGRAQVASVTADPVGAPGGGAGTIGDVDSHTGGSGGAFGPLGRAPDPLDHKHVAAIPGAGSSSSTSSTPGGGSGAHAGSGSGARHAPTPIAPADPIADLMHEIAAQPIAPGIATATRDPKAALDEFQRQVATGKGEAAARALYAMAWVQHLALGRDADALRSLDAYVRRFPDGAETEPVLWMRVRILCGRALDEPCRVAAHTYLPHGTGTRAHLAERITNAH